MRQMLRSFARQPGFTAAAVLTIALGIGVNTAVFSVIRAVLIEPLPFREPNRLAHIWESHPEFSAGVFLALTAVAATLIPAMRATRAQPGSALRIQ